MTAGKARHQYFFDDVFLTYDPFGDLCSEPRSSFEKLLTRR
jgi:hypothetical protein